MSIDKRKIFGYFFAGMLLIFMAIILREIFSIQELPKNVTKKFTRVLHQKEKIFSKTIEKLKGVSFQRMDKNLVNVENEFQELYKQNGIILFIYENDSLIYWSSNSISCPEKLSGKIIRDTDYFGKQKNGWYEVIRKKDFKKIYIGQILIKQKYLFENEYLKNTFEKAFHVPEGTDIDINNGSNSVFNNNGRFLFFLKIPINSELSQNNIFILFILYLSGFILLLVSLYKLYCKLEHHFPSKILFFLSFSIDVVLIRLFQFYFHLPNVLYKTKLFGPDPFLPPFFFPHLVIFL